MGPDSVLEPPAEADRNLMTRGRPWLRLALEALAIVVLATAWLAVYGQADAGAGYLGVPPVTLARDGIPIEVNGERVYRIGEAAKWQKMTGEFLLAGWAEHPYYPLHFPARLWDFTTLAPSSMDPTNPAGSGGDPLWVTQEGSTALGPWAGDLVVVRTHNADPSATDCVSSECLDKAVDEVVWPTIPATVGDERVFRVSDSAQFEKSGTSFLVGGIISTYWSCDISDGCLAVGGRELYPALAATGLTPGQVVVLRVHLDPDLHVVCNQSATPADCVDPFILDELVGSYDPYSPPYVVAAPPAPTSPILQVGPDGVPLTVDGQTVFRQSNLPVLSEFLLGGRLARDASCPSVPTSDPSVCGWTVDGVAVRALVAIPDSLAGRIVVVHVVRTSVAWSCSEVMSPCPVSYVLVVTDIVVGG